MYYGIVIISVLMFGIQFYFNDNYQKESGTGASSVFVSTFVGAVVEFCFLPLSTDSIFHLPLLHLLGHLLLQSIPCFAVYARSRRLKRSIFPFIRFLLCSAE